MKGYSLSVAPAKSDWCLQSGISPGESVFEELLSIKGGVEVTGRSSLNGNIWLGLFFFFSPVQRTCFCSN